RGGGWCGLVEPVEAVGRISFAGIDPCISRVKFKGTVERDYGILVPGKVDESGAHNKMGNYVFGVECDNAIEHCDRLFIPLEIGKGLSLFDHRTRMVIFQFESTVK